MIPARYENRLVRPDAASAAAIAPAARQASAMKTQPIGLSLETPFARGDQLSETGIADLVADGTLASTPGADVAVSNGGSLRTDLPAGPLTYGSIYELYPFDNRIVTLRLTGDQLTRIIAYNLERKEPPFELLPIAGFKVDAKCDGKMLRVMLTRSSGATIRADERLTVATSDPSNLDGREEVKLQSGCDLTVTVAPSGALREAIDYFYHERPREAG